MEDGKGFPLGPVLIVAEALKETQFATSDERKETLGGKDSQDRGTEASPRGPVPGTGRGGNVSEYVVETKRTGEGLWCWVRYVGAEGAIGYCGHAW